MTKLSSTSRIIALCGLLACTDKGTSFAPQMGSDRNDAGGDDHDSGVSNPLPGIAGLTVKRLASSAESYPFGAAEHMRVPVDLKSHGYIEEEFIVSGAAKTYDWSDTELVVRTEPAPYATRLLVRRPDKSAQFSGRVILEMLNPTNSFDLEIGWALSSEHFMREGDAWVGITSKPIAVLALKTFDPERYAALSWANPLDVSDPGNCTTDSGLATDSTQTTENGLVWDIYSQIGRLLRSDTHEILAGYPVQRLYGFGYSQTGGFLLTYINAIHPRDVQEIGKPLFDAYLVGTYAGLTPIHQCATALPRSDPRMQTRNVGVPIIRIVTQSDYILFGAGRREDSDALPDAFRLYEVAGAAHATPAELDFGPAIDDLTKAQVPLPATQCEAVPGMNFPRSSFPLGRVFNAAWANLDRWVKDQVAPPSASPIAMTDMMTTTLDAHGNAVGGLRTPYVDVPTRTWFGNAADSVSANLICFLAGYDVPFDSTTLSSLYPTHDEYVRQVQESTRMLVDQRFLLEPDGEEIVAEAMRADIP
jgi:hypothetical protein